MVWTETASTSRGVRVFSLVPPDSKGSENECIKGASSSTMKTMQPLDLHQVQIQVITPATATSTRGLLYTSSHPSPTSNLLKCPELPITSTPSPVIHLDDIRVQVKVSDPEALYYSSRHLSPTEQALISAWLSSSVPLASLRRASAQLVRQLELAEAETSCVGPLELRAQLVAEATGLRAARDAERDVRSGVRAESAATVHREKLTEECRSVQDALAQFDVQISAFAKSDPASAALLIPVRQELQDRLRELTAKVAAYGGSVDQLAVSGPRTATCGESDDPGVDSGGPIPLVNDDAAPEFDPESANEAFCEEESSVDDEDIARAVLVDASEFTESLPVVRSTRDGYISSDSDPDVGFRDQFIAPLQAANVSGPGYLGGASFVIDLDGSPAGSQAAIGRYRRSEDFTLDKRGSGKAGRYFGGRMDMLRRGGRGARFSEDTEDGSDLERNAARRRANGRARRSVGQGQPCPEREAKTEEDEGEVVQL